MSNTAHVLGSGNRVQYEINNIERVLERQLSNIANELSEIVEISTTLASIHMRLEKLVSVMERIADRIEGDDGT